MTLSKKAEEPQPLQPCVECGRPCPYTEDCNQCGAVVHLGCIWGHRCEDEDDFI